MNRRIVLAARPHGFPQPGDFRLEEEAVPVPREGEVLLRTLYMSLDPYMRGRMNATKSYANQVEIGEVMTGRTVSRVVTSRDPTFQSGDVVLSTSGWQEYATTKVKTLIRLDPKMAPVTTALGVLGMPGLTAYSGLLTIGKPMPGETVVVAAATGPVGSAVGRSPRSRAPGRLGSPEEQKKPERSPKSLDST